LRVVFVIYVECEKIANAKEQTVDEKRYFPFLLDSAIKALAIFFNGPVIAWHYAA